MAKDGMPTQAQVQRAIKALDAAYKALEPLSVHALGAADDSRVRLRSDINEYLTYLENARWWKRNP